MGKEILNIPKKISINFFNDFFLAANTKKTITKQSKKEEKRREKKNNGNTISLSKKRSNERSNKPSYIRSSIDNTFIFCKVFFSRIIRNNNPIRIITNNA